VLLKDSEEIKNTAVGKSTEINKFNSNSEITILFFYAPDCKLCIDLLPRLKQFFKDEFADIKFGYVNVYQEREFAAKKSVYAVPTLLLLSEGKELLRESRNFGLHQLKKILSTHISYCLDQ
jgi:thioredoxin